MASKVYARELPWQRITKVLSSTDQKVRAAVAYIGADAQKIMPLKKGDVLICDASKGAITSGSTSAEALRKYIRDGVDCYSCPGLHAKLILLPRKLFIGSANASANSRDNLIEAVLETADKASRDSAARFIDSMMVGRFVITKNRLKPLLALPVRNSFYSPSKEVLPTSMPSRVTRLWIRPMVQFSPTKAYWRARENSVAEVSRFRNESYKGCTLEDSQESDQYVKKAHLGDWIIEIINNRVNRPRVIIGVVPIGSGQSLVWCAQPKGIPRSIRLDDYLQFSGTPKLEILAEKAFKTNFGLLITGSDSKRYLWPFLQKNT